MIRLSTILWLALVGCVGFGMFEVKYAVTELEDTLAKTNKAIVADEDAIHVLKAEWSYLSQPSRLEELSRRFLELKPMSTTQLGQLETLPMRPEAMPPQAVAGATLPQVSSPQGSAPPPAPAGAPAAAPATIPVPTAKPAIPTRFAAAR
jgi:hypothetical protein